MELRTAVSPRDVKHYTTERLREEFLISNMFPADEIRLVYSHIDRIITGGIMPVQKTLVLTAGEELRAQYFLERREMGVINIGGTGIIVIDGKEYTGAHKERMYIGMGAKDISFSSVDVENPAKFYMNSAPAHASYPTVLIKREGTPEEGVVIIKDENKVELGSLEDSNHRTICKYILPGPVWSRAVYGIPCHATPMTEEWKYICILKCLRMLSLCITWENQQKQDISLYVMSRRLFHPAGPFIQEAAPEIILLSGVW